MNERSDLANEQLDGLKLEYSNFLLCLLKSLAYLLESPGTIPCVESILVCRTKKRYTSLFICKRRLDRKNFRFRHSIFQFNAATIISDPENMEDETHQEATTAEVEWEFEYHESETEVQYGSSRREVLILPGFLYHRRPHFFHSWPTWSIVEAK